MKRKDTFSEKQLALLQEFFDQNHARCFWSWNPKVKVKESNADRVLKMARTYGGADGYALAIRLDELSQTLKRS